MEASPMETIRSIDSTPIAFERSGSGPPLVLVHGAAGDHRRWDVSGVREALARHHELYAMDRRGRGQSGDSVEYRLELEFKDVAALVRSIDGPVDLLGHSYGALCALEAALRAENLRRLILYEPPIPLDGGPLADPGVVARVEALVSAGEREEALIVFLRDVAALEPDEIRILKEAPSWPGRVAAAHTLPREERAADGYHFDPARFHAMRTPTLLLAGGESDPLYQAATRAVSAALPLSRTVVLEGQKHVAMNTAPERFVREVVGFLGAPDPPGPLP
jgi:pimeloyl-ACP methyl ester carboxylesterase